MPDQPTQLDRIGRQIDRARQRQAAHVGCQDPACATCVQAQTDLDRLYRRFARLALQREVVCRGN